MAWQEVEQKLETLLNGKGLEEPEQYDEAPENLQPVKLKKSVSYIVLAVIFNEQKDVLVIQEAKQECYGKWYLPAGRMELNESIIEAMKREVQEETGLECEPRTLLAVQEHGPSWIRYVFLAETTGGTLKTTEEADAESLQATWWDRITSLSLRASDILPLIDLALQYQDHPSHPLTLPHQIACTVVSQRLLVTFSTHTEDLWVLLAAEGSPHLPVTACGSTFAESRISIRVPLYRLLKHVLPDVKLQTRGILALQHLGKAPAGTADGICLNLLVSVRHNEAVESATPPAIHREGFQWFPVPNGTVKSHLLQRLSTNTVVPLHS
ncbi:8-oxo-dGDP phosphatase NUDT18 [Ambystoma mexicanum]|uniref:8-oxo-dGDP phosphatase NUDT18 n=1 Tax=Ambystoma mexicanum TaxID=8296 RepID=UPI0037E9047F